MSTATNPFQQNLTWQIGDKEEQQYFTKILKNGTTNVEVQEIVGGTYDSGATYIDFNFKVVGEDEEIKVRSVNTYVDSSTGKVVEAQGCSAFARAIIAFKANGKDKVSAKWKKEIRQDFEGEDYEVYVLQGVAGTKLWITTQIERQIYNNEAKEANKLKRVLSADGLSLGDLQTAIEAVKAGTINTVSEFAVETTLNADNDSKETIVASSKSLAKELNKTVKYRYSKCEEDEWLELADNGEVPEDDDEADDSELDDTNLDEDDTDDDTIGGDLDSDDDNNDDELDDELGDLDDLDLDD